MAVASSAFDSIAGIIKTAPNRYEKIMAGPEYKKAREGRIKIPELIIAPEAIQKTSAKPRDRFNSIHFSFLL